VKLYLFKKIFLTRSNEVSAIKKGTANQVMDPLEYPVSAALTEGFDHIKQI
jgi:hypothetical protein